jgi:hypothetical protein
MVGPLAVRSDLAPHLVGALSLVASLVVYCVALEALRRERRRMSAADVKRVWWFGYTRDLMNILALVLLTVSHNLLGFPGPAALMAGFIMAFSTYLLDYALAKLVKAAPGLWPRLAVMLLLALPALLAPGATAAHCGAALKRLFY